LYVVPLSDIVPIMTMSNKCHPTRFAALRPAWIRRCGTRTAPFSGPAQAADLRALEEPHNRARLRALQLEWVLDTLAEDRLECAPVPLEVRDPETES